MRLPLLLVALAGASACVPVGPSAPAPVLPSTGVAGMSGGKTGGASVTQAGVARRTAGEWRAPVVAFDSTDRVVPPPAGTDSIEAPAAGPSWDIAVAGYESNPRVEHYLRRYTGPARSWVTERLSRGTRYEAMIRGRLRAAGLPEDMYYLAFVESGFDSHAYSRAAAVGMWQFMTTTGKGMGLRIDWWTDERRDPVRSTRAAVRFLSALNDQFGSLYLAAAAYNGGPTRVSRGLRQHAEALAGEEGEARYFVLAGQDFLPRETREYVPQLIAAALIGNDPARYGISIERRDAFAYDSVDVAPLTSLPAIARASGADMAAIKELNPQFLRGMTPPGRRSQVRIPVGSRARFDSAFAAVPDSLRMAVRRERLKKAAPLAVVARELGTTPGGITAFNPKLKRTKKRNLAAGQTLFVPAADVLAASLDVPDPSAEGSSPSKTRVHVVASGETLGHIALRYDTSVAALKRLNGLKRPLIRIGQELRVPPAD